MAAKKAARRRAPRRVWIELSADYDEIYATQGSFEEAAEACWHDSKIAGPYVLQPKAKKKGRRS